jgi:hypothetical protein
MVIFASTPDYCGPDFGYRPAVARRPHRQHYDQLSAGGVSYFTQEVSSLGNTPAVLPKALGPMCW